MKEAQVRVICKWDTYVWICWMKEAQVRVICKWDTYVWICFRSKVKCMNMEEGLSLQEKIVRYSNMDLNFKLSKNKKSWVTYKKYNS